jgi:hypothetical protein
MKNWLEKYENRNYLGATSKPFNYKGSWNGPAKNGSIIQDNEGYWNPDNWGHPVEINSNQITMQGVYQPLIGISDTGDAQLMEPGKDYKFKGKKVTEFPIAQNGRSVGDNTLTKPLFNPDLIKPPKSPKLNTEEFYTKKRNQKLISGALNTGSAVAPPGMSNAFDAASIGYGLYTENEINPLDLLKNNKKVMSDTGMKPTLKTVPGLGRFVSAYQAAQDFYDAKLYNDSINLVKNRKLQNGGWLNKY